MQSPRPLDPPRVRSPRPHPPRSQWPVLLLIAGLAAGTGIMGTLLMTHNASSAPAYVPVAPPSGASEPPPMLTQGLAPAQAEVTLGNWFYDHERWAEGASHYKNALAGGADNADVRTDLGNCLRFSGDPRGALEQYQIAQKQDPRHEQSLFNQGGLWAFSLGDKARGIALWKVYLKKFPQGQSAADARRLIKRVQSGKKS